MPDDPIPQKRCSKCGEIKLIEMFSRRKRAKDGRRSECKVCVAEDSKKYRTENAELVSERGKAYHRENAEAINKRHRDRYAANPELQQNYRAKNREKISERQRRYYNANPDYFREYRKTYYITHKEEILAQKRAYHKANAEAICEKSRIWRQKNPERFKEQLRTWQTNHPGYKCIAWHRRRARIKDNGGTFTLAERNAMEIAQAGRCAYCKRFITLTIDHIIPIDQRGRHEAANICLACADCNNNKHNRTPEQWVNRWYYREAWWIAEHGSNS